MKNRHRGGGCRRSKDTPEKAGVTGERRDCGGSQGQRVAGSRRNWRESG